MTDETASVDRTARVILIAECKRPTDVRIVEDYYNECEVICGITYTNLQKMAKFWLLREEIVERLENWANGMCQEYCVHSRDKEEDCFCNDPIFKKIEEIGE